jgi:hypothetical protein
LCVSLYIPRIRAASGDADWRCSTNLDAAIRGWVEPALQVLTPDITRNPDEHAHDDHEHTAALEYAVHAEPALMLACIATWLTNCVLLRAVACVLPFAAGCLKFSANTNGHDQHYGSG